MSPADGTILCWCCAKKSRNVRRSSSAFIELVTLPAGGRQLGADLCLALLHRRPSVGHRGPQVLTERPERTGEIGRHPFWRVALDGLTDEADQPERHAEPESGSDHEPEQSLEHQSSRPRRKRRAARPVPDANAMALITGLEKAR